MARDFFTAVLLLTSLSSSSDATTCTAYLRCDRPGDTECTDLNPLHAGPGVELGGRARPIDAATKDGLCQNYASSSCCSAKFIDKRIWPEFQTYAAAIQSARCLASFMRVACFLCDPKQASFMEQSHGASVPHGLAIHFAFDICQSSCHTWYEDCKDDPGFAGLMTGQSPDGNVDSEAALCKQVDQVSSYPGLPADMVSIDVVDESALPAGSDTNTCFLYDDLAPMPVTMSPPNHETGVDLATQELSIAFNEHMVARPGGEIVIYRQPASKSTSASSHDEDGSFTEVHRIAITDSSHVAFTSSKALSDNTLIVRFDDPCPFSEPGARYRIQLTSGALTDVKNNSWDSSSTMWEFSTSPSSSPPSSSSSSLVGPSICAGKDLTTGDGGDGGAYGNGVVVAAVVCAVIAIAIFAIVITVVYIRRKFDPRRHRGAHSMLPLEEDDVQEGAMVSTKEGLHQVRLVPVYKPADHNVEVELGEAGLSGGSGGSGGAAVAPSQVSIDGVQ